MSPSSSPSSKPSVSADFRFLTLGETSRFILAGGCFALGAAVQLFVGILPGSLLILAGWFPLALRRVTNKPTDQGLEEWRPVSASEIDRLADTFSQAVKTRREMGAGAALRGIGFLGLVCISFVVVLAVSGGKAVLAVLDGALFFVPALFFGRVSAFVPGLIAQKMRSFQSILAEPVPEGFALTPYLRFDKDKDGRDVPEDLRFLLEPKRKTGDLVGAQFQVAINSGPNGPVPYMYAVILTRGRSGPSYASLRRFSVRGYEVEPGGDDQYGAIVVRQNTKGTGYYTKLEDCRALFRVVAGALGPA